jgi:hypothetical protein
VTAAIVLLAVALLAVGLALGDSRHVFINATLLCLSCIGIQ